MISTIASSITQSTGISQPRTGGRVGPTDNATHVSAPQDPAANTSASETMDFTNMSSRDMTRLVNAGTLGDSFPPLIFLPSPYDPNPQQTYLAMQDTKVNYVAFTQNRLAEAISRGDQVSATDSKKFLDVMMALQGKGFPETSEVNAFA